MKAILSYSLYRRPNATNEEGATGYLTAGSIIEVTKITPGKLLDGISVWFYAEDGFYYWGGGIEFSGDAVFADWDGLDEEMQKALLESLVADDLFWFQKKVTGYVGCGWGLKNDDRAYGLAVSVFVNQKAATAVLDKTIRYRGFDVPVDVKEVGTFHHHEYIMPSTPTIAPDIYKHVGGSISIAGNINYGTRSMFLIDKNGNRCLMTCFHVLLGDYKRDGKFPLSDQIEVFADCPSNSKEGNPYKRQVRSGLKVIEGQYNGFYDYAMVVLPADASFNNIVYETRFSDYYLIENLKNLVNETVTIAGATSGLQKGKVLHVKASLPVNDGHVCYNVVVAERLSSGGDSGAPVIDKNGKLVGIVVAGDNETSTLILPVTFLFTLLDYKLF